ncbi:MAG: nucleotide exchange factor GrpE [Patescibacteria group bacterium]|nr:nucleotide exchange factor GrpE [Patescibacteria group bacterium]
MTKESKEEKKEEEKNNPLFESTDDAQKSGSNIEEEFDRCKKERDEYLDGWKRAKADFINYKKEEVKRFEELIKFGTAELIQELVTILDSFDLGLAVLKDDEPAKKGIQLIEAQFEDFLKKHGFSRIIVLEGQVFDPKIHEAVGEIESLGPEGVILEEVRKGHCLYGKVIRPSRVLISKIKGQLENNK